MASLLHSSVQFDRLMEGKEPVIRTKSNWIGLLLVAATGLCPAGEAGKRPAAVSTGRPAVLWEDPADIASRDLFYGSGGKQDAPPAGAYTFLKEDLEGTNPKFDVRDRSGVKWKVKLGIEARPETTASRLVWAAGYFTNEDYFVPELRVEGLPARLHRGQKLVGPGGTFHNVRLKREEKGEKKAGNWAWRQNPFVGSRQLNGLKAMMALVNNWDLKDVNNAIYPDGSKLIYMVSDLGASFGAPGRSWPASRSKDNWNSYSRSKFIRRETSEAVDFETPARPRWMLIVNPKEYFMRVHLEWIGRNVPRDDARWMGKLLSRLSPRQIEDAFRAGGYSTQETAEFSRLLSSRIATLNDL